MPNIYYYEDRAGKEHARWPGSSKRVKVTVDGVTTSKVVKVNQMHLGLVINKEKLIFYTKDQGFYQFDPGDLSRTDVPPEELSRYEGKTDGRRRERPVIIQFGGCYFLDCLVSGIGYDRVMDAIQYQNRDRLYAMLQYYLLENGAASRAETWYEFNYAKFLYPKANLSSQRISDFHAAVGRDENRRRYLMQHIRYLLKSTDEELCILVDSSGMPNKCRIPYTRVSNHDGDVNIEFRVIVVVQKSTGLPVYYELIPGNVVDASTVSNVMEKLRKYGYDVQYALGDAAYSCPSNIEKLVLAGIDFLTRLNPAYDLFKDALDAHMGELEEGGNEVMFNGRVVSVVKSEAVIARDAETGGEVKGHVYLCRDHNAWHSKSSHLMNSKRLRGMSPGEIRAETGKYGIFALVSTKEIPEADILKEYYIRQGVEQFFDYAKNYAQYLPVRNHSVETLRGHLLLSFMATFFLILIKNRLKILDSPYAAVPRSLKDEADSGAPYAEIDTQQGAELMIRQDKQMDIFKGSPSALFAELQFQMADVFDDEIVPSIQVAGATQFYKAYHIGVPEYVALEGEGLAPVPKYKSGEGNQCSRRIAFARRPSLTAEQIEERRKRGDLKKLNELAEKCNMAVSPPGALPEGTARAEAAAPSIASPPASVGPAEAERPRRGRGRPKGSKNKKTLVREAEAARLAASGQAHEKRKPGRPKGSLNKSTLERLAEEQSGKVRKGKNISSKNKVVKNARKNS